MLHSGRRELYKPRTVMGLRTPGKPPVSAVKAEVSAAAAAAAAAASDAKVAATPKTAR